MLYETREGHCTVVGPSAAGERLQRFASRAFREHVGGKAGLLHSSARLGAAAACSGGRLLVNGAAAAGRQVLREGDVVTLRRAADATEVWPDVLSRAEYVGPPSRMLHVADKGALPPAARDDSEGRRSFRAYYRDLQRVCEPDEWDRCETLFDAPLPVSLRLNRSSPLHAWAAQALRDALGSRLEPVPWMDAHGGAAHVAPAASEAEAEAGVDLVKRMSALGDAVVQDAASMLPVLALAPEPSSCVLDACAAPGGKTCHLLDAMCAAAAPALPSGALVASDLRPERAQRVCARARCQGCAPLVVAAHDAAAFPALAPEGFDRILCDVPCSSDGMSRKEVGRLARWSAAAGGRNHPTQLAVLLRGLSLLRRGGRLVYSTCSLNPLEDEAVVRAALLAAGEPQRGRLRLVPADSALPAGCPRGAPGLLQWRAPGPDFGSSGSSFGSPEEVPEHLRADYPDTLFCGDPDRNRELGLGGCARLLPTRGRHMGGFFLAVFESTAEPGPTAPFAPAASPGGDPCAESPLLPRLASADPGAAAELAETFGLPEGLLPRLVLLEGVVSLATPGLLALRGACADAAAPAPSLLQAGLPLLRRAPARGQQGDAVQWAWQVCPEGSAQLGQLASRRQLRLPREALAALLRSREAAGLGPLLCAAGCAADGPVLVAGVEDAPAVPWLAGSVLGGDSVCLLAPQEALERCQVLLG